MNKNKTWDETWGKVDKNDAWGWCKITPKDIDEMVVKGADVNHIHIETIDYKDCDKGDLLAFNEYPLELAALNDNIEACKALQKHGAIPKKLFRISENEEVDCRCLLQEMVSDGNHLKMVSYLLEEFKLPVTSKVLIEAIRWSPAHFKLLLAHFDLKAHPDLVKRLLKENIWSEQDKKAKEDIQSLILNVLKKENSKNNQPSRVTNLKSARINSGR